MALPREKKALTASAWLCGQLQRGRVNILATGMGIADFPGSLSLPDCRALLNVGVCGALQAGYRIGDAVLPSRVLDGETGTRIDLPFGSEGILVTVGSPVLSKKEKQSISGDIVDMECFPQALWAKEQSIHFYCLKVVSDTFDTVSGVSAHLASLGAALQGLTESVENFVKNLVENDR
ncbi:MAG: hypothetical protein GXO70_07465 [Acidobacteria bacterium]|nr:hypothetical protein [Acidobacteriota bacterium]